MAIEAELASLKQKIVEYRELIQIHEARLHELKKQQALKGINTPPEINIEIQSVHQEIERLQSYIVEAGQKISQAFEGYDVKIQIEDLDNNIPAEAIEMARRVVAAALNLNLDAVNISTTSFVAKGPLISKFTSIQSMVATTLNINDDRVQINLQGKEG